MPLMDRDTAVKMLVVAGILRAGLEDEACLPVSAGFLTDLDVLIEELQSIVEE